MKNQDLEYFKKGSFENINTAFIFDGLNALSKISEVQRKYKKNDMDTILNELHDAIVGQYLGFKLINTEKHGLDCKFSEKEEIYLESKVATLSANSITATFNDTTFEKAEVFKDEKVWLALSVWASAAELMFICYGQNEKIGEFLEEGVKSAKENRRRSTQTISLRQLLVDYDFKLLSITKTKEELYTLLTVMSPRSYKDFDINKIIELKDFEYPYKLKEK